MARLLVVDDEEKIREMIRKYARFEGYEVDEASDGFSAVEKCEREDYDLIIMDVMMPDLDGFSAVKAIRRFRNTPVIMLSARGEEYDRIHGFEVGVDDYVVKPFSVKELMMRIAAILARGRTQNQPAGQTARFEGLEIDYAARIVKIDGQRIDMSPKEYELLFFMSRNKNMALSRETLLTEVWGYDYYGDDRTLDTHIKLLRRSLGEYQKFIVTVRGVGYRFDAE
ncbi:MAG: response regulator transcription factor [Erysipelotrichaceae bacterium]|nr:response regulator transcription factor [Erysipelotrichaceae bacterium]